MKRLILAALLMSLCLFAAPLQATAYDPFGGVDCSKAEEAKSAVCQDKPAADRDPIGGTDGIIANITNIVAIVAGMAAVIVLIMGGLNYITSGGESSKVASAKGMVINALIGIVVIALARTLIIFVIGKL